MVFNRPINHPITDHSITGSDQSMPAGTAAGPFGGWRRRTSGRAAAVARRSFRALRRRRHGRRRRGGVRRLLLRWGCRPAGICGCHSGCCGLTTCGCGNVLNTGPRGGIAPTAPDMAAPAARRRRRRPAAPQLRSAAAKIGCCERRSGRSPRRRERRHHDDAVEAATAFATATSTRRGDVAADRSQQHVERLRFGHVRRARG